MITGGTSGLGRELVKYFHAAGYSVYTTGRDQKGFNQLSERYYFIQTDFSDLSQLSGSIKGILREGVRFDLVINNAGVLSPPDYTGSKDGIEYSFQVNFLSHLLIDELIVKSMSDDESLTIISVTSPVYRVASPDFKIPAKDEYRMFRNYSFSKFYMLLTGSYLKSNHPGLNIKCVGFDPGTFGSGIYRMQKPYFRMLYSIASPFMKRASAVARALGEVTEAGLADGQIYKNKRNKRTFFLPDNPMVQKFFSECNKILSPYF